MNKMEKELVHLAELDVLRRYDRVRGVHLNTSFYDETYKHIFLPVYSTAYTYKDKQYHVLINGENGNIKGEYPKSVAKIIAIVLIILIIVLVIYYMSSN